jgi:hypothetical protein
MSKRAKKRAAKTPAVTVRFANPTRGTMAKAKKRSGGKKRAKKRNSNPGNPARNPRRSKGRRPSRRRRNPETFVGNLTHLAGAALVGLAAGTLVLYGQAHLVKPGAPPNPAILYGVPAVGLLVGAALAKKAPTIGAGIALGSIVGPFAIPVATKLMTMGKGATPAQAAALAAVHMGAVDLSDAYDDLYGDEMYDIVGAGGTRDSGMSAVTMGRSHAY